MSDLRSTDLLTTSEAAALLGISASTMVNMRRRYIARTEALLKADDRDETLRDPEPGLSKNQCIGPRFVRFGKKVFYRRADLLAWIDRPI